MILEHIAMFILLGLGAIYDYNKQEVPDLITSLLWLALIPFLIVELSPLPLVVASSFFGALYFYNTIHNHYFKKPFMGWADILAIPPYMAGLTLLPYYQLGFLGIGAPLILSAIKKKSIPMLPFLAANYFFIMLVAGLIRF